MKTILAAITTRDADLDDTRILAQSGLNWETITQECKKRSPDAFSLRGLECVKS